MTDAEQTARLFPAWRRRHKAAIAAIAALAALVPALSASAAEWQRVIAGTGAGVARAVVATADGGYVVAGRTEAGETGNSDAWLIKLDAAGETVWERTLGGKGADSANALKATPDGGYVVAGLTRSSGAGETDGWIVKLDAQGGSQWQHTFGGRDYDAFEAVALVPGGGYLLAGYTRSKSGGKQDGWVLKLDASGRTLWEKTYGDARDDVLRAAEPAPDGGYVLAGQQIDRASSIGDAWVLRIDAAGKIAWEHVLEGSGNDIFTAVAAAAGGGFVVAGQTESQGAGGYDAWLVRLGPGGERIWQRTFGGPQGDGANAVLAAAGGGAVIAGTTRSGEDAEGDAWVLWSDDAGDKRGERSLGRQGPDAGYGLAMAADGSLALVGATVSTAAGGSDAWIARIDPVAPAGGGPVQRVLEVFDRLPWLWIAGFIGLLVGAGGVLGLLATRRARRPARTPTEVLSEPAAGRTADWDADPRAPPRDEPPGSGGGWVLLGYDRYGRSIRFRIGHEDLAAAPDGLVLGRNPQLCHMVVSNTSVSRRHLRLSLRGGRIQAEDLNSTNGTYVNGRLLAPLEPSPLPSGASLILGDFLLRVLAEDQA